MMRRVQHGNDDLLDRAHWLGRARQQAQALDHHHQKRISPFDWERLERRAARSRPSAPLRRVGWAAALTALVLGSATGTWALVRQLDQQADDEAHRPAAKPPRSTTPGRPPTARHRLQRRPAPAPAPPAERDDRSAAVAPPRARRSKTAAKASAARRPKGAVGAGAGDERRTKASANEGRVIFDELEMPGGGEMIIVRPRSKLKPLFSTEAYRQRGPGHTGR